MTPPLSITPDLFFFKQSRYPVVIKLAKEQMPTHGQPYAISTTISRAPTISSEDYIALTIRN